MGNSDEIAAADGVFSSSFYENVLQEAIRKDFGDDCITVRLNEIQDVVPSGENYMSSLHRLFLEILKDDKLLEKKVIIVKALPKGAPAQQFVTGIGLFRTEITMYQELLPKMDNIASNLLCVSTFSGKSYNHGDSDFLVMEDLKQAGFKMADRHVGLDLHHCEKAIRVLARFHGSSVALVKSDDSISNKLPPSIYRKENVVFVDKMSHHRYKELSAIIETWPGFEKFGDKLREFSSKIAEKVLELNDPNSTKMAVLNHGDFWVNNMLFKHKDTGEVEDVKFIDFQLSRFASPAIDLNYFLVTSPNDDVRKESVDSLLEVYHSELCRVLKAVNCGDKVVTLDWLRKELRDKMPYALHVACLILNATVAERDDAPEVANYNPDSKPEGQKSVFSNSYNGARYRQILQGLLLMFEEKGVL